MKYLYRISLIFMILTIMSALILGGYFFYQTSKGKEEGERRAAEEKYALEASAAGGTTDCDTEYIVLEYDLISGNSTPYVERIPAKYIGKTKEEMEVLLSEEEKAPTLRERQKGLTSIRLSAFSGERIVVVKSYETVQEEKEKTVSGQEGYGEEEGDADREAMGLASHEENEELQAQALETMGSGNKRISELIDTGSYYLLAREGYVCVYYEDMKTIYLATDIIIDHLPDQVRQEILDKKYMKNEEELYNFLESYSS